MMVKIGNEYVNPDHVTNVFPISSKNEYQFREMGWRTALWVIGNAGYGTKEIFTNESIDEVIKKLNSTEEKK